ncbi:MAG: hypothetical protein Q9181_005859 [Wetmoreana brouardii]
MPLGPSSLQNILLKAFTKNCKEGQLDTHTCSFEIVSVRDSKSVWDELDALKLLVDLHLHDKISQETLNIFPRRYHNVMDDESTSVLGAFAAGRRRDPRRIPSLPNIAPGAIIVNQSVEMLLLDIILELQLTPCWNYSGDSLIDRTYSEITRDLKTRRDGRLQAKDSIELVQDYLTCIDELSLHIKVVERKRGFLLSLRKDFPSFDGVGLIPSPASKYENPIQANSLSCADRFEETLRKLDMQHKGLTATLDELKSSLDVVSISLRSCSLAGLTNLFQYFQLKTIEQNERALLAETNNQAILVFTVVTVIFLPLSFFTSYFGMNLDGIADTEKREPYFWKVCGSTTLIIVVLTLLFGFKRRLHDAIWTNRSYSNPNPRNEPSRTLRTIVPKEVLTLLEATVTVAVVLTITAPSISVLALRSDIACFNAEDGEPSDQWPLGHISKTVRRNIVPL